MLTVFWDLKVPVVEYYLEIGKNNRYSKLVSEKLKPAIQRKHWGKLLLSIVLLHDNTCLHNAAHMFETSHKIKFEILAHPLYSPDFTY